MEFGLNAKKVKNNIKVNKRKKSHELEQATEDIEKKIQQLEIEENQCPQEKLKKATRSKNRLRSK